MIGLALTCVLAVPVLGAFAAETPKRGGILTFVVASGAQSFDFKFTQQKRGAFIERVYNQHLGNVWLAQ